MNRENTEGNATKVEALEVAEVDGGVNYVDQDGEVLATVRGSQRIAYNSMFTAEFGGVSRRKGTQIVF